MECPLATVDKRINLINHRYTVRVANLGPPDPRQENAEYWQEMADKWEVGIEDARTRLCSNCEHYIYTEEMKDCMRKHDNITPDMVGPGWVDTKETGGWCNLYNITCTASRTCVDWEEGGPITTENKMEDRDDAMKAPKTKKGKQAKIAKVMREFKAGTLKGSDKKPITNRKQAIAIALSEAGMSMKGKSDSYVDAYIDAMMCMEVEEPENENEMETEMDGSCGKKR